MKQFILPFIIIIYGSNLLAQTPFNNSILSTKNVNTTQMISVSSPHDGSILYNQQDTSIFLRTNENKWHRLRQKLKICNQYLNISDANGVELPGSLAKRKGETLSWTGEKWKSDSLLTISIPTAGTSYKTRTNHRLHEGLNLSDKYYLATAAYWYNDLQDSIAVINDGPRGFYSDKFVVVDISNPENPTPIKRVDTKRNPNSCVRASKDLLMIEDVLYVGGKQLSLFKIDDLPDYNLFQNPNPTSIFDSLIFDSTACPAFATYDLPPEGWPSYKYIVKMKKKDNWLYCFWRIEQFKLALAVYDVSDPENPVYHSNYILWDSPDQYRPFPYDVHLSGDWVYYVGLNTTYYFKLSLGNGVSYAQITNHGVINVPIDESRIRGFRNNNNTYIVLGGQSGSLANNPTGQGVFIINISNPNSPVVVSSFYLDGAYAIDVVEEDQELYVYKAANDLNNIERGKIIVYDISNPGNPLEKRIINSDLFPHRRGPWSLKVKNGYCYFNYDFLCIPCKSQEGSVGIGETNPSETLEVNGQASKPAGGNWSTYSDSRLKKNIRPLPFGLKEVRQLKTVEYQYNSQSGYSDTSSTHVGVIAQEIEKIMPNMVTQNKEVLNGVHKPKSVDNSSLLWTLINAIKELKEKIEHEKKIDK